MRISHQAQRIAGSPTLTLNEKANALRAAGKPVINLTVGEPKNETPQSAVTQAVERLNTRQVKYTAAGGTPAFKDAIIQYTAAHYGCTPARKNILVTVGAKQSLFNALYTVLDSDDEAILMAPYWVSYPEMVKLARGKAVVVSPEAGSLTPDFAALQKAVTPRTRAILCNSPNNPSGRVYEAGFIEALVEYCEANGIYLILDDIYHQLVYGDTPWVPGYNFTTAEIDASHLIVVNGVSKTYGMTGFRIGWVVAAQDLIQAMTNIQGQTTSGASVVTQDAALGALNGDQAVVAELRDFIRSNRDLVMAGLGELGDVRCAEPQGAFYCLPDFSAYNPDSMALAAFLLEKAYVAVVPGAPFGMEGHVRVSYAGSPQEIAEGLRRIRWALDPDSPEEITMGGETFTRDW